MKKSIVGLLLILITISTFSQENKTTATLTPEAYLKKSKTQKMLGFISLGAGAITLISVSGGNTDFNTLGVAVVAGSVITLASIPLFIAAARNKRKAKDAQITFKLQNSKTIEGMYMNSRPYPAIALRMSL